jgi:uncharacterized protein (TIGR02246 family)
MYGRILTSSVVVLLSILAACDGNGAAGSDTAAVAQAGAPKADKAADEASLRAIYHKMPQLVMAGDAAGVGTLFADDGMEILAGMPSATGPAAVQKAFADVLGAMKNLNISFGNVAVNVADAGDLAVVEAPYEMTFNDPKGKKVTDHGTTMTVFRKIAGQWKILYDTNVSAVASQ